MSQVSARVVLFGESDPGTAVASTPAWRTVLDGLGGVLATLSPEGQLTLYQEVSRAIGGLLNLDVVEVLVGGWRKHRALHAAAGRTRASGGAEQVELASHRITTTHRPYLEVSANGVKIITLHFDLGLTLDVETLVATVRQARIMAVQGGRCTVTAGLGCEGVPLASRQVMLDPHVTLALAEGIRLLADEHQPAEPARGSAAVG
jgi:hypothetical protein